MTGQHLGPSDDLLAATFAEELSLVARRWRELDVGPCAVGGVLRDEILAEIDPDQLRAAVVLLQRLRDRLGRAESFS